MPKNPKTGTPHKKNAGCYIEGCDARTRNLVWHLVNVHDIDDPNAWWEDYFEAKHGWRPITVGPYGWPRFKQEKIDAARADRDARRAAGLT